MFDGQFKNVDIKIIYDEEHTHTYSLHATVDGKEMTLSCFGVEEMSEMNLLELIKDTIEDR